MRIIIVTSMVCSIFANLYPILDGRAAPIVLDSRYTFSNYEWARGFVSFRAGFDLPIGGTITLRLDSTTPISRSIGMNDGTLILEDDLHLGEDVTFTGSGFLQGNGHDVFCKGLILHGNVLRLQGSCKFLGVGYAQIGQRYGGVLDLTNATFVSFSVCRLDAGILATSVTRPVQLLLRNVFLASLSPITWLHPNTIVQGALNQWALVSDSFTINQKLTLVDQAQLNIEPGGLLQLGDLDLRRADSRFILRSSILDIAATVTDDIILGSSTAGGSLVIDGQSIIRSSSGNNIIFDSGFNLELLSGSRLTIDDATKITIF